jgi:pimeloyl-ACP methyl ester carboxylesterase
MRGLFFGLAVLLFSLTAHAKSEREFFLTIDEEKIFVRHKPAAEGQPTLVLLNGLTYSTRDWNSFASALQSANSKVGILRFDFYAMGKTLLEGKLPVFATVPYQKQVSLLAKILRELEIDRPHLVGLSYGGGIAIAYAAEYPSKVGQIFLMAPFTEPLESQDRWIRTQIHLNRIAFPYNPASDDELYDYFLRQIVFSTYPSAEPSVLENPYKLEAVFRMVQGIRKFQAKTFVKDLPENSIHLLVANQDQYIPQEVMDRFWKSLPKGKRASRINISYSEHKIPEAIPAFTAAWILEALTNPLLQEGKVFEGTSWRFEATTGAKTISLPKP